MEAQDKIELDTLEGLYQRLLELDEAGVNGIWARIIKNAFAPLFEGRFDYVAGNPPWVNWESLPGGYREALIPLNQDVYMLFPHTGLRARHGSAKVDLSTLMLYVSADRYLMSGGSLGFVITQSIYKTDAGKGFRRFKIGDLAPLRVAHIDDMVDLKPFEGASNRTSVLVLAKGRPTKYPISYTVWTKSLRGRSIPPDASLEAATELT